MQIIIEADGNGHISEDNVERKFEIWNARPSKSMNWFATGKTDLFLYCQSTSLFIHLSITIVV